MRSWLTGTLGMLALLPIAASSVKADPVEDFYKGKTVRAIIGYSVGGGYDTYTRVLAAAHGQAHSRQSHGGAGEHARRRQPEGRQLHL